MIKELCLTFQLINWKIPTMIVILQVNMKNGEQQYINKKPRQKNFQMGDKNSNKIVAMTSMLAINCYLFPL